MQNPNFQIGDKVLVTTDAWFYAPDGKMYRAAFGTVHAISSDEQALGIKTNARSTNWYATIGNLMIAGCQIHYAVKTDYANLGNVSNWSAEQGELKEWSQPCSIYDADQPQPGKQNVH